MSLYRVHVYIYMTHFRSIIRNPALEGRNAENSLEWAESSRWKIVFPLSRWIAGRVDIGITVADGSYRFYIENTDSLVHRSARRENAKWKNSRQARIFLIEEEGKRESTRKDPIFLPPLSN